MSANGTVDTRTVEMRFDNSNFESNAKQTMSTLDKLKRALKLDGASAGLREVERESRRLDFKDFGRNIDNIGKKFNVLETIATGALYRIGMKAADAGEKMVKSLTVDQIAAGWNKYAEKTTAVQTIMANLKDDTGEFVDQASKMEYVNRYLRKLMWFSDETSYSFTDMTGNVGKFIANGQNLEDSVVAMQGIATWAAMSGQNAQTASRAMYNISQAMGVGSMKVKDWMSIENANMATAQFKELAIAIAQNKGKIKEGQVTVESFRESLSGRDTNGWFDKEVMMEVFQTYGEAATKIQAYSEKTGRTATSIISDIRNGNEKISQEVGVTADSIGFKALAAAQEAKTFGEVVTATADAVSTKWLSIFENIFGNYLQAKEMWTGLSEDLWDMFAGPLDTVNEIMSVWNKGFFENGPVTALEKWYASGRLNDVHSDLKLVSKDAAEQAVNMDKDRYAIETLADGTKVLIETLEVAPGVFDKAYKKIWDEDQSLMSGRTMMIEGFKNLLDTLVHDVEDEKGNIKYSIFGTMVQGLKEILFEGEEADNLIQILGRRLWDLTKRFRDFTERMKPSEETLNKIKNAFKGVLTLFKIAGKFISAIFKPIKNLFSDALDGAPETILDLADAIATWIQELDKWLDETGVFESVSKGIQTGIDWITTGIDNLSKALTGLSFKELKVNLKNTIFGFFQDFDFSGRFSKIGKFFTNIVNEIAAVSTDKLPDKLTPLQNFWLGIKNIFEGMKKFFGIISPAFKWIGEFISSTFDKITTAMSNKKTEKGTGRFESIWQGIRNAFQGFGDFFQSIGPTLEKIGTWIGDFFRKVGQGIATWAEGKSPEEIVESIIKGGFIVSLTNLFNSISSVTKSGGKIGKAVADDLSAVKGVLKAYQKEINASMLVEVAMAIGILSGSLWVLAQIPADKLDSAGKALMQIAVAVGGFSLLKDALKILTNLSTKTKDGAVTTDFFSGIKNILVGVVNSSIFANDATAKFVKICLGLLLAAAAAGKLVKAVSQMADEMVRLGGLSDKDRKALMDGAEIVGRIVLLFGAFAIMAGIGRTAGGALFAAIAGYILIKAVERMVDAMAELGSDSKKMESVRNAIDQFKDVFDSLKKVTAWVIAIGAVLAIMQLVLAGISKGDAAGVAAVLKQFGKTFIRIALSMVIVAAAVWLMAEVAKNTDADTLTKIFIFMSVFVGIVAVIAGIAVLLAAYGHNLDSAPQLVKQLGNIFLKVSLSLLIVAAAFWLFSMLTFPNSSLATISVIFGLFLELIKTLVMFSAISSFTGKADSMAKSLDSMAVVFLAIAGSLAILAGAFWLFSIIPFDDGELGTIVAIFAGFMVIVGGLAILAGTLLAKKEALYGMAGMAGLFLVISSSLVILAAAFNVMNSVDSGKLLGVSIIFGAFMLIVGGLAALAGTLLAKKEALYGMAGMAGLFVVIAASLVVLAAAFKVMDTVDSSKLLGVGIIFGIFMLLAGGLAALAGTLLARKDSLYGLATMAGVMLAAAASLALVALAFSVLAQSTSPEQMDKIVQILIVFGIVVAALAAIGGILGNTGVGMAGMAAMTGIILAIGAACLLAGAGFLLAAYGMKVLTGAFDQLVNITITKGAAFSKGIEILAKGFAAAIVVMGNALKEILLPLVVVGLTVSVLAVALSGLIISIGVACLIAGVGIALAAFGLSSLAQSFSNMVTSVANDGPAFVANIKAVIEAILNAIISLAPKMALAGIALIGALATAIIASSSILANAGVVTIITLVSALLSALVALIPIVISALADILDSLATAIEQSTPKFVAATIHVIAAIIEAIIFAASTLAELIPGIGKSVSKYMRDWIPGIRDAAGELADSARNSDAFTKAGKEDGEAYNEGVEGSLEKLEEKDLKVPVEVEPEVKTSSDTKLSGAATGAGMLAKDGLNISQIMPDMPFVKNGSVDVMSFIGADKIDASSFTSSMTAAFGEFNLEDIGVEKMDGFMSAINGKNDEVESTMKDTAAVAEKPIKDIDSKKSGNDLIDNFCAGIKEKWRDLSEVADATAQIIHDILGFSEPDKGPLSDFHTYAPDMIALWCKGVRDNLGSVKSSSESVADTVYDGFSTALDYVSDLIDNGMSDQLTIRPIMDLSNVESGIKMMDGMMGNNNAYTVTGTASLASSAAYGMRRYRDAKNNDATIVTPDGGNVNNTFYITNNDPNAVADKVSRIISNQTRRKKAVWAYK